MPHRSRLAGFIIDCRTGDLAAAATFWSAALGLTISDPDSGTSQYAEFGDAPGGLHVEVQKVEHDSRVHLDIEADDIDARSHGWKRWARNGSATSSAGGSWKRRPGNAFAWWP